MRILISRPDKIGDLILALHPVKQLRKLLPEAEIFLHINPYTEFVARELTFIDGYFTDAEQFAGLHFDQTIDLIAKYKNAKELRRAKAKINIGNSARGHSLLYNRKRYLRRSKATMNEAQYNWELISLAGRDMRYTRLEESLHAADFRSVVPYSEFSDYLVLMPGKTVSAISWATESWHQLALKLAKFYPSKEIIFLSGPAEAELKEDLLLFAAAYDNIHVRSFDRFPELCGFLLAANHYVGTSTGITHLASALGKRGTALYPTKLSMHPSRWLPFKSQFKAVRLDADLTPEIVFDQIVYGRLPAAFDPLKMADLSTFVITLNEEKNITTCLDSVRDFSKELVLIDSGSTDQTIALASQAGARTYLRKWTGNKDQKQYGLDLCEQPWVFNIDADEEVSDQLAGQIKQLLRQELKSPRSRSSPHAYNVSRLVYFLDRWWDQGGWYPEFRLRLFRRDSVVWGGRDPHEKAILTKGRVKKIQGHLYHYTYTDVLGQVQSLKAHAAMMADSLISTGRKSRSFNIILNPMFRFFKFYIMKRGYREGFAGFLVGIQEAYYTYLKYLIFWEKDPKRKKNIK